MDRVYLYGPPPRPPEPSAEFSDRTTFAERFGFVFLAREKGDANRSVRVERPMGNYFQSLGFRF
jgi:hypothetical protein